MNFLDKKEGSIFFIPLFLPTEIKENTKSYTKYKFNQSEQYAFGRLIENDATNGDLIEIFRYIGTIPTDKKTIINSGLLFYPIHVALGFSKNHWRFVFEDLSYNKYKESDYSSLTFLLGNNREIWKGGIKQEVNQSTIHQYEEWIVFPPTKVEKKIKEMNASQ